MYSVSQIGLADVMLDLEKCPLLFGDNPIVVLTVTALVLVGPPPSEVLCQRTLQNPQTRPPTDDSDTGRVDEDEVPSRIPQEWGCGTVPLTF